MHAKAITPVAVQTQGLAQSCAMKSTWWTVTGN